MESDIREAFETRIAAFAAAQTPAMPVAWENVTFAPSPAIAYLQCFMMPAPTQNPWMGVTANRLVGIFQINVYGIQDEGAGPTEQIADALIALFPRGTGMQQNGVTVNIDYTPTRAKGMSDPRGFFFIPVRIRYRQDVFG